MRRSAKQNWANISPESSPTHATPKMTPVMRVCRSQMTHHVKTLLKMSETWVIHVKIKLINMKIKISSLSQPSCMIIMKWGNRQGSETQESAGNVRDNCGLVTPARNGETRVGRGRNVVRKQPHPLLPPWSKPPTSLPWIITVLFICFIRGVDLSWKSNLFHFFRWSTSSRNRKKSCSLLPRLSVYGQGSAHLGVSRVGAWLP